MRRASAVDDVPPSHPYDAHRNPAALGHGLTQPRASWLAHRREALNRPRGSGLVGAPTLRFSLRHSLEVDISALDIRADQLHAEPVTYVQAFNPAFQSSFHGRLQQTDPRAFVSRAGDDGIE